MRLRDTFSNVGFVSALFANGAGDHLLALPSIRALTTLWPNKLTLYVARYGKNELWASLPLLDLIELDLSPQGEKRLFELPSLPERFWQSDMFISLVPWMNSSLLALAKMLPTSSITIGYHSIFRYYLPLDFHKHSSDLYFDSARCCAEGANIADFASHPTFSGPATAFANDIRNLLPEKAQLLAVHLDTLPEKQWPAARAREVIVRWLNNGSDRYAVTVGSRDILSNHPIDHPRYIPLVSNMPFGHCAALVSEADGFFGVDSSFHHVADLARVPSVCLFGPTRHEEFGCRWCVHHTLQSPTGLMKDIGAGETLCALESISAIARLERQRCFATRPVDG